MAETVLKDFSSVTLDPIILNHGWTRSVNPNQMPVKKNKTQYLQWKFAITRHYFSLLGGALTGNLTDSGCGLTEKATADS